MPNTRKRLGATTVAADTDTALYTVPASTETQVAGVVVCNRGNTQRTYRIAWVDGGGIGSVADEDYLWYDTTVDPYSTVVKIIGLTLGSADTLLVRANHADVNFVVYGMELA